MEHGPLQDALEAQRRLHVVLVVARHARRRLVDELGQLPAQLGDVRVAGLQDFVDPGNVEQREQQVLHGHELVALVARVLERFVQAEF